MIHNISFLQIFCIKIIVLSIEVYFIFRLFQLTVSSLFSFHDSCLVIDYIELNQKKIGKTFKVLFDRKEGDYFIGRTEFDSPDVDNEVLVRANECYIRIGDFANVLIEKVDHFDLYGVVVN